MVFKIKNDLFKRKLYIKNFLKKELNKSFFKNPACSIEERQFIKLKNLKKFKFSICRIKNHCILTQNTKSIYKNVKLSRHIFKNMVLNGQLPGCILVHGKKK